MSSPRLARPLKGIIPPMVTPLASEDSLDHAGLERLIEHTIGGGVHGLFILGTTGEGPALSYRLRRKLIERTCAQVAGRIPVLVGITDASFDESCALAAHARKCGADAVVTAPPFYFVVNQAELLRLVRMLAARVDLPLYLYNMPRLTKCSFEPETVMRAAELPNVWGLKDSSGEIGYLRAMTTQMRDRPDFALLVGPEHLLMESLQMGVHGGVCGGANLFPKLFVSLYETVCKGNLVEGRALQQKVLEVGALLYGIGEAESSYLRGLKLGMELMGICGSTLAPPFAGADARLHAELAEKLREYA